MEVQGLAHLLEHMVLLGSEKYPAENEFESYVEYRGGSADACTDGDYTLFFFSIQHSYFREALDRFASFFFAPLLRQECVSQELETVHDEFIVSKSDESLRFGQLVASLANEGSPYRCFGFGNRTSLRDKPMATGTNVYELLREFHLKYYNASLMTLAVESEDTLDDLQTMVTDIFGSIPNRLSGEGHCIGFVCLEPPPDAFALQIRSTEIRRFDYRTPRQRKSDSVSPQVVRLSDAGTN
ncbi:Nardilysin [Taenia solium]|eukprot:TsM_000581300 transcript=TsM_000581300 gene=TsM_000581300